MLVALAILLALPKADPLADGFRTPPLSARPHTWWHWMDGNVTKEGLTADLEAMKQVGIGGVQLFTVAQGIPKGPVDYNSPLWHEMTTHAIKEAGRLGIEVCIHNCAGWSSSGGPWVTPENAMQVLAWSEVKVSGPTRYSDVLPPIKAPQVHGVVNYQKDIAVYAFRTPASGLRDKDFLGKTGVNRQDGLQPDFTPAPADEVIPREGLIQLTADSSGKLDWDVPTGEWTILRMGHVPTGKNNHPAPPEGDGLEVDKLSRKALDAFWDGLMAKVIANAGPGSALNNALVDSYEVYSQNWTPLMREEFRKRRGYDLMPYLPIISGRIVQDKETTERFLWDFRRTIADLFADNYFGYFAEKCHQAGLKFSTEPYGSGGFDAIQCGGKADIPMGEFWIGGLALETTKIAASVGHVYGRPIIGAESFTADDVRGKWLEEPFAAKSMGDLAFCNGINRYIFHRYAHQPWMDLKPGMTMGPWGTHLERTQTWWTEAATWLQYVARCQFLLQRGKFVADALYYVGENSPTDWIYGPWHKPTPPAGYDFDSCDVTAFKRLSVKNGRVVAPSGISYRVLVLPDSKFMTAAVARKVKQLVLAGATVAGTMPEYSPSLSDGDAGDREVKVIAEEIWPKITVNRDLKPIYERLKLKPDFEFKSVSGGSKLAYIHRQIDGAEVYFVSNQQQRATAADCTFRVANRLPELWHADTGKLEAAPVFTNSGGRTTVPLRLQPSESVFVVFRRPAPASHLTAFDLDRGKATASPIPVIRIKSARYETADGRGSDVTSIVAQMVREGNLEIPASNSLFGDPVVNVVKALKVEYEIGGRAFTRTVAENESLILFDLPATKLAPYDIEANSSGVILTPWEAGKFVATSAKGSKFTVTAQGATGLHLSSNWKVAFPPGWGAPASISLQKLTSWSEHEDIGVKYFSGSGTYSKEFDCAKSMLGAGRRLVLELGKVKNFATVQLNGKAMPVLWKEPFTLDVTKNLKVGKNRLEIKVTNLWPNRIIGDEQLPPDVEWQGVTLKGWPSWMVNGEPRPKTGRFTFTTWKFWNKDSKLLESGLLGPVVLRSAKQINLRP